MFDYFDYNPEPPTFTFVLEGQIVGEFTADMRSAAVQAEEYRDATYPGAKIFTKVVERSECEHCNPKNEAEEASED